MRIGGYEVLGALGQGGMGIVYRARSPEGTEVAIKLLARTEPEKLARFEKERRLLGEFTNETAAQKFEKSGWEWDRSHEDGHAYTSPVGSFPRGASPVGACDMAGNVWQWCEDWFDARAEWRVARGGCWISPARYCRAYTRFGNAPGVRDGTLGFRVVLRAGS